MRPLRCGMLLRCLFVIIAILGLAPSAIAQLITATPGLKPGFDLGITDYTVPSAASSDVQVSVNAPAGVSVSIDGQPFNTFTFNATVSNLTAGQKFTIQVKTVSGTRSYYVRRTPSDFPTWTTDRPGAPQAEFYVFCPDIRTDFGALRNYVIVADNLGVPVWWYRTNYCPIDAKLLPG